MNRSVPPSPGDKARHLMFQPRRSSRPGAPRWFPPDGDQAEQAEQADSTGATAAGSGSSPAADVVVAAAPAADQRGYEDLGFDADVGSESEAGADVSGTDVSGVASDVSAGDASADVAGASASSAVASSAVTGSVAATAPADATAAAARIRAVAVKPPDAAAAARPAPGDVAALLVAQTQATEELARRVEELARLRRHDADLVDRLHAENSRLRQGELTEALAPLLRGLIRVHDQMASLGGDDTNSVAGILKSQLLQVLDLTVDVRPFDVPPGTPFDPARHLGVRGVPTDDPELDRTTVRTVKPGFLRGDSAVVRPAETEVYRAD